MKMLISLIILVIWTVGCGSESESAKSFSRLEKAENKLYSATGCHFLESKKTKNDQLVCPGRGGKEVRTRQATALQSFIQEISGVMLDQKTSTAIKRKVQRRLTAAQLRLKYYEKPKDKVGQFGGKQRPLITGEEAPSAQARTKPSPQQNPTPIVREGDGGSLDNESKELLDNHKMRRSWGKLVIHTEYLISKLVDDYKCDVNFEVPRCSRLQPGVKLIIYEMVLVSVNEYNSHVESSDFKEYATEEERWMMSNVMARLNHFRIDLSNDLIEMRELWKAKIEEYTAEIRFIDASRFETKSKYQVMYRGARRLHGREYSKLTQNLRTAAHWIDNLITVFSDSEFMTENELLDYTQKLIAIRDYLAMESSLIV